MKISIQTLLMSLGLSMASVTGYAQNDWFAQFGGSDYQRLTSIERDSENNIILSGTFRADMDSDPGLGEEILSADDYDEIFVIKLNENGEFIWSFRIGAGYQDFGRKLVIDQEDNIHIVGTFQGVVDFDPGAGTHIMETAGEAFLSSNMYIAKYSPDGEFIQALQFRSTVDNTVSSGTSLAIDSEGNLLVSGNIYGPVDMDPLSGEYILEPETDFSDMVIAKLTSTGTLLWAHILSGDIGDSSEDITVDESGNIYYTGLFRSNIDFDPGAGVVQLAPQGNDTFNDIFILSLDGTGSFRWVKGIGWDGSQNGRKIKYSPDGFIYAAGAFTNTINFNPDADEDMLLTSVGDDDCYLMKIASDGEVQWAKSWGGIATEFIYGLSFGPNNEIITVGSFRNEIDLNSEISGLNLTSAGEADGYLLTWETSGDLTAAFSFGGEEFDYGTFAHLEANNKYLLAGVFSDEIQLQQGNPDAQLVSIHSEDSFLAFFEPSGPTAVKEIGKADFSLYPNPANNEVGFSFPETTIIDRIKLIDVQGRLIKTWISQGHNKLNVSGILPGLYTLVLETKGGRVTEKLLIE